MLLDFQRNSSFLASWFPMLVQHQQQNSIIWTVNGLIQIMNTIWKHCKCEPFQWFTYFLTQHRIFNFVPWHWISQISNNFNRLGPVYSLSWPRTKTTHWKLDKPYGFIKLFRSSLWNLGSAHRCKDLHTFHVKSCLYVLVFLFSNQPIYVFVLSLLNDCDVF